MRNPRSERRGRAPALADPGPGGGAGGGEHVTGAAALPAQAEAVPRASVQSRSVSLGLSAGLATF